MNSLAEGTAKAAKPQRDEQAYQAYRAGERAAVIMSLTRLYGFLRKSAELSPFTHFQTVI